MSADMSHYYRKLLLLVVIGAWLPATFAQDELLNEEQPPIKFYTVELIVFAYAEDVATGTEVFPAEKIEAPAELVDELVVQPRRRRHPDAIGLAPVLLRDDELSMHDTVERLELLDAYDPILHVGWTHAGFPQLDTDALPISHFGEPPQGLSGSFKLYLERYLHLVVDLALDAPADETTEVAAANPVYAFGDSRLQFAGRDETRFAPVRYRIEEDRIIKNGETRYFDHPKFGVIAKVIRVEETDAGIPAQ